MRNNIIIGITGGIGSGKSAVSKYLSSLGENAICADAVSRKVVQPGEAGSMSIRREFGDGFFLEDNTLNREKLAATVFSDKKKLSLLNSLLHPIIVKYMFDKADKILGRVFLDASLLIQTGMHKRTDFVWLVTANMQIRINRVMMRDGMDKSMVQRRMDNQMEQSDMIPFADEIIDNNGDLNELYSKIDKLLKKPEYKR